MGHNKIENVNLKVTLCLIFIYMFEDFLSGECEDRMNIESKLCNIGMQQKNFSDRALQCFEKLNGEKGVWDIFVTKHAEVRASYY